MSINTPYKIKAWNIGWINPANGMPHQSKTILIARTKITLIIKWLYALLMYDYVECEVDF